MTLRVKIQLDCTVKLLPAPKAIARHTPCSPSAGFSALCEHILLHDPLKLNAKREEILFYFLPLARVPSDPRILKSYASPSSQGGQEIILLYW